MQRRVTASYEYSEDRGTEINKQSVRTVKLSAGLMESLLFKLFYLTFIAVLLPIKISEFTIGKTAWIGSYFGFSHSTYNLRRHNVNKNLPHGKTLPSTNRFANFLSKIATSCFFTVFLPITKLASLPLIAFSYIFGQSLDSIRSQLSLQQQTAGISLAQLEHYPFKSFSLPSYIAENLRERVAYALANVFGPRVALLVGYEEVRPVKRKRLTTNLESAATESRQKIQLFPTRGSVKYSAAFWKWLFPLFIFLLLLIMFYKRHDSGDDLMVGGMELFGKVQQSFSDGWKQKIERGLNLVLKNALYSLFVIFRFLYDLFLYPAKLCGTITHSESCSVIEICDYGWSSVGTKAMTNMCNYNFLCRIPSELYRESAIIHFFESTSILGSSLCASFNRCLLFQNGFKKAVISSEDSNDQQAEWTLEHLRHEKELLELKVLQLRREREVEEGRYKNIHKVLRIIEKGPSLMLTDKQCHSLVVERRLMERLDALSEKIENEIAQKIIRTSHPIRDGQLCLMLELSELSSAVGNLRAQFDKELPFSLSRFEKASHEEREAFRLEIMKAVENRVVTLFASHTAEKSGTVSETKLNSVLGSSKSNFMIIKKMITDALDTYDADKTGKVEYALESSEVSVVSTRCTKPYKENSRLESVFGIPLWYSSYSPRAVIQLSHPIYVTEVSYERLHSTLHPDGVLRSAAKLFQVYSELSTPIVELVVQSNWDSGYTCLYRFRVHGQRAISLNKRFEMMEGNRNRNTSRCGGISGPKL
uniref:SUN domain-containing protein n=1 Tax=Wuchereria bancrofti TaxID=6293 RepID=A0A1I8ELV5_WUCBA